MRAMLNPFVVLAIDVAGEEYAPESRGYRIRLFQRQAEARGLHTQEVCGFFEGQSETAVVVSTTTGADVVAAMELGRLWDQNYVCQVNADSSAYSIDLKDGGSKFKGFWKKVPSWRIDHMLKTGTDYTRTLGCYPEYYVVGS